MSPTRRRRAAENNVIEVSSSSDDDIREMAIALMAANEAWMSGETQPSPTTTTTTTTMREYKCPRCTSSYKNLRDLRTHRRKKHGEHRIIQAEIAALRKSCERVAKAATMKSKKQTGVVVAEVEDEASTSGETIQRKKKKSRRQEHDKQDAYAKEKDASASGKTIQRKKKSPPISDSLHTITARRQERDEQDEQDAYDQQISVAPQSQFMTDLKRLKERKEALLRSKGYSNEEE